ncbi:ParB/RepB/Spo0J family partition protein [Govanella unica]|uniref:ParB/RepB/Spo0J family partition protein n=1 Tax=Govanella unica TaxID=2975056 RepID=A0A9X3Z5T4_9PROT|nr:ParB/RepB/Spo0J family partition protein [Govania unica]MDA5192392.1 ParB/RepB/Spo0J family partition protein [Govania unica]
MTDKDAARKTRPLSLGRGLSALLGSEAEDYAALDKVRSSKDVPIELLRPNRYQPRHHFAEDHLEDLVNSIREKGILQPILVRRLIDEPDQYEIIAGERRWRAAQRAKLHRVPVVIRDYTDGEALEVAIIENVQRADLSPIEEALGYERLMREFGHTQEQIGQLVGKSRSHVANLLRLLTLPPPVQEMLGDGRLSMGHARALINAEDPVTLARQILDQQLNVRATEDLVRIGRAVGKDVAPKDVTAKARGGQSGGDKDPDTLALERDLSVGTGLRVAINDRGDGAGGQLVIDYKTLDQLDEVCRRLCQR